MITIRQATIEDSVHIAALGKITFKESFEHLFQDNGDLPSYLNQTFAVPKIKDSIRKKNNVFFISFVDDLPVGYAKLKLNSLSEFSESKNISQLQKIYVLKDFLSMKIGHHLQEALFNSAKKNNSNKIWLSVHVDNERAINFYRKHNFADLGYHSFDIGTHKFEFLAMIKKLE